MNVLTAASLARAGASGGGEYGYIHIAVFGRKDAQFRLRWEQRRRRQHLATHRPAEGAQFAPSSGLQLFR